MTNSIEQEKLNALSKFLEIEGGDTRAITNDDHGYEYDGKEYDVFTEEEADERAADYIKESLWAFNYSFLADHSEAISKIPEKDFQDLQGKLCESFNDAIAAMLDSSFDDFVADAISADGRGHFLNTYDGEEHEANGFYIYRTN